MPRWTILVIDLPPAPPIKRSRSLTWLTESRLTLLILKDTKDQFGRLKLAFWCETSVAFVCGQKQTWGQHCYEQV